MFFTDTGATCDNIDDYDEVCPHSGSTSPDVVYSFEIYSYQLITFDLCGSSYDTKIYIYDEDLNLLACNDDYYFDSNCGFYTSYVEFWWEEPAATIYIVIDGYGGDCDEYTLEVGEIMVDGFVVCPPRGRSRERAAARQRLSRFLERRPQQPGVRQAVPGSLGRW